MSILPLLLIRSLVMLFEKQSNSRVVKRGFEPPSTLINHLLTRLGRIETFLLNRPIVGTSILLLGSKHSY